MLEEICRFLDVPSHDQVLTPYAGNRMTDGVHSSSIPVYGPDSLPRQWCRVSAAGFRTRSLAALGFFVLRLHPRGDGR